MSKGRKKQPMSIVEERKKMRKFAKMVLQVMSSADDRPRGIAYNPDFANVTVEGMMQCYQFAGRSF